ncbi:hypothetical protein JCM14036_08910 [Desulfotomaculum defluvii]
MELDKLVEIITTEVLRRLKQQADTKQTLPAGPRFKAMAIFTGGTIGLSTGLEQLRDIKELGTALTVVLSEAAEKIVGIKRIQEELGCDINLVTAQSPYPKDLLHQADIVIVPVLTQNTAAKIAYTIADTMASYLILSALMQNKPIIAAIDAADPDNRPQVAMAKVNPAFREALQTNLIKLGTYGIQLSKVENLAAETKNILTKAMNMVIPTRPSIKQILDAETIRNLVLNGDNIITVPKGTIVTPLARDLARELHTEIIYS